MFPGDTLIFKVLNLQNFNKIQYRGPDNTINKKKDDVLMTFHRLAIMDLSSAGNQPFQLARYPNLILMCNGEIYNHRQLRKEMESNGIKFKSSHSDTETLLNGLSIYGLDFINKIGLKEHLSATRANGLLSMIKQMKFYLEVLNLRNWVLFLIKILIQMKLLNRHNL